MGIQDIETASAFGALDGDALTDGRALDAHTLRTMALQANRLVSKQQQIACLIWPEAATSVEGGARRETNFDARRNLRPNVDLSHCQPRTLWAKNRHVNWRQLEEVRPHVEGVL